MPLFTYRAINEDNKEIRGQIEGIDLNAATSALESTHLDVVEIHEASHAHQEPTPSPTSQPVLLTTFAFEGTDASGTVRRGTIQSETKHQAFEKLKQDQKFFLTMLSPLGVTPQFRDQDLENWQRKEQTAEPKVAPKVVSFTKTAPVVPTQAPKPAPAAVAAVASSVTRYHSLVSTLRLYAGWLLAWYGLFVALGYYATVRSLPWDVPFVQAFSVSPLIFTFIAAMFLFLLLGSLHRVMHAKLLGGTMLAILGIGLLIGVQVGMQ